MTSASPDAEREETVRVYQVTQYLAGRDFAEPKFYAMTNDGLQELTPLPNSGLAERGE